MPSIKIQRKNEYFNILRDYRLIFDGEKISTIANGKMKEFEVEPGHHKIIAKIDWCSSNELSFDIGEKESKIFLVGGIKTRRYMNLFWSGLFLILLIQIFTSMSNISIYIIGILLVFYFLDMTIGRKNFLTLTELRKS